MNQSINQSIDQAMNNICYIIVKKAFCIWKQSDSPNGPEWNYSLRISLMLLMLINTLWLQFYLRAGCVYSITMAMDTSICHCHMCTVSYSAGAINQRNMHVIHISGGGERGREQLTSVFVGCLDPRASWNDILNDILLRTHAMLNGI